MSDHRDVVIVGGGAAGLMAAISAARENPSAKLTILDGARKLGAKILVSGGTRCNVTHERVDSSDFAGGSRHTIKKILARYGVEQVVEFFEALGVRLKTESTGKLFPISNSAKEIVNALLEEARRLNIEIKTQCRVTGINRQNQCFELVGDWGNLYATKIILSTGGKSLPKSGSDGLGYQLAQTLGHTQTDLITPALVPLLFPQNHAYCSLSGLTLNVNLKLVDFKDKVIADFTGSLLLTHFGLSGPVVLDISRYWVVRHQQNEKAKLLINWLPEYEQSDFEQHLMNSGGHKYVQNFLKEYLPAKLVTTICQLSEIKDSLPCDQLSKQNRKALMKNLLRAELPITGDRGYNYAEVTAGGIPLNEIDPKTMQSRVCDGLYLCGEICDVDGRIGGFNFQWAWSSGYIAGLSSVK